ncbi:hypothetical protein [Chryseobacterium sp. Leaf394]|uniref:hypothetical protein n=1 Tax=Chryseobacterium sp. Leaf394 TaxID=1736361 RepID=UPI000701D67C|nr:hypothetical protein [Chryseobacterium sp. Leaf394]KQS91943.1 hypothetical protein ASG21_05655 [Chryseobacterium sp. Leaf394]
MIKKQIFQVIFLFLNPKGWKNALKNFQVRGKLILMKFKQALNLNEKIKEILKTNFLSNSTYLKDHIFETSFLTGRGFCF